MSKESEERLAEWAVWFHSARRDIPADNLGKQNQFLLKAVDGALECLALAMKDIQILERRSGSPSLWLPNGMKLNGQVSKFSS